VEASGAIPIVVPEGFTVHDLKKSPPALAVGRAISTVTTT
jgi:hypothetical protein